MVFLTRIKHVYRYILASVFYCLAFSVDAAEWPQDITTSKGLVTIYQPQPETLQGNRLTARAAISFVADNQELTFGVFWFNADIDSDSSQDQAILNNMTITQVRWPDSNASTERAFTVALNNAVENAQFMTAFSELTAGVESAQASERSLAELRNEAPAIVFSDQPTILLNIDGDPEFSPIDNTRYERLLNTGMAVIRDTQANVVYLTNGDVWYQALGVTGPYVAINNAPIDLERMFSTLQSNATSSQLSTIPKVVVATEPTEIIATDGPTNWKSLPGGQLMYASNTETPWLRELASNDMYVLLSGRWFRAKQQNGPWTFVRSDQLPGSFANIPAESDLSGLRVSIAGTEEAEEAILDAQVPQTVAINRKNTQLSVTYDGQPQFQRIPNTAVAYAINTDAQVILVGGLYYAVDNAVWFKANSPIGPWLVADKIPKHEIAKIPPSSPVFNITYVDIYESTPEIVYVGYYPGYVQSFIHFGVPVYGTGWHYRPYRGRHLYYPRPLTWGLNAGYNIWSGWSFGLTWSQRFFYVGRHWNAGYRAPRHYHHPENRYRGYRVNPGKINIRNDVNFGRHQSRPSRQNRIDDLYRRNDNIKRNASPNQLTRSMRAKREDNRKSRIDNLGREDKRQIKFENDKLQQRNQQANNEALRKQLQNKQENNKISNRSDPKQANVQRNDVKQNRDDAKQNRNDAKQDNTQLNQAKQNRVDAKQGNAQRNDAKQNRVEAKQNNAQRNDAKQNRVDAKQNDAKQNKVNKQQGADTQSEKIEVMKGRESNQQTAVQSNNLSQSNLNKNNAEQSNTQTREARKEKSNQDRVERSATVKQARSQETTQSSKATQQNEVKQQRSSKAQNDNKDRQQRKSSKQSEEILLPVNNAE